MTHPSRPDWLPACTIDVLRARATMLSRIRRFFEGRGVLEVETPLVCRASNTDPHLQPFSTRWIEPGASTGTTFFLQTSPEFAMKRLLASGSGSIFQVCKAFRNEEAGRHHNPEFTLLEWYRVGLDLPGLVEEIELLIAQLCEGYLPLEPAERLTYSEIFQRFTGADPLAASLEQFAEAAGKLGFPEAPGLCGQDRPAWLDFLFSHAVQPHLGRNRISFVTEYPAILPSLARRRPDNADLVDRVELFLHGLELGNGFQELADAREQDTRFEDDLARRRDLGLPETPKDERLLAALSAGLPDCSGVAIGLDRLLMIMLGAAALEDVLAFPINHA